MKARTTMAILACVIGTAWADKPLPTETKEAPDAVQELLTNGADDGEYVDRPECIPTKRIRRTRVLDEHHVVLNLSRGETYLIRMGRRCQGLRRNRQVMLGPRGRNLCAGDAIRPAYRNGLGGLEAGGACAIPGFERVTPEQLDALLAVLKAERRRR